MLSCSLPGAVAAAGSRLRCDRQVYQAADIIIDFQFQYEYLLILGLHDPSILFLPVATHHTRKDLAATRHPISDGYR